MLRSLLVVPLLLVASSCATVATPVAPGLAIGEPMQKREILTLATVQSSPTDHFNQTLLVEARITAVCQSMGCWMQIEDGERVAMVRWEEGCEGRYSFPKDSVGERVLIQGSFYAMTIDPADVEHLESEGASEVPAQGFELNASAVVMLDR